MNKKIELLKEAVRCYKVHHINGYKNEKLLLDYIDELEQLTIPAVGCSKNDKIVDIVESALYKNDDDFNIQRYPDGSIKSIDEEKILDFVKYKNS